MGDSERITPPTLRRFMLSHFSADSAVAHPAVHCKVKLRKTFKTDAEAAILLADATKLTSLVQSSQKEMHVPAEQFVEQVVQTTPKCSVSHDSVELATQVTASVQSSQEMHVPAEQIVEQVVHTTPRCSVSHDSVELVAKVTALVQSFQKEMHVPAEQIMEQVVQTTPKCSVSRDSVELPTKVTPSVQSSQEMHVRAERILEQVVQTTPKCSVSHDSVELVAKVTALVQSSRTWWSIMLFAGLMVVSIRFMCGGTHSTLGSEL